MMSLKNFQNNSVIIVYWYAVLTMFTGDIRPMYNFDVSAARRVDPGETLDPSQNIKLMRYHRGRGQVNEGPFDDTALIRQYLNTRETLDPKLDLHYITPTPAPGK